jgi:hypothetical protein
MVRCGQCQALFYLCRRDDRGQRYCPGQCQALARQRSRKEARQRHQRSELGRLDHCDAQRRYRARRVMDQGSKKLAPTARVCRASAPDPSMVDPAASDARNHETHDEITPMHSAAEDPPRARTLYRQVAAALHRSITAATHPPQHLASVRCAVCGRPGRFVREGYVRPPPRRARRGRGAHARAQ